MKALEKLLEHWIVRSRWLMAPFYVGLSLALLMLMVTFVRELAHEIPAVVAGYHVVDGKQVPLKDTDIILLMLSLIDMSLAGNLLLTVIFAGYENFVSKIDVARGSEDRPAWMGTVDFGGLKLKLIASIVAISGIHLLKSFMKITDKGVDEKQMFWLVTVHLTFVVSGVLLALMDRLTPREEVPHKAAGPGKE
ncbi:MAG: TIGR00645 family protein [Rhodospirillaceae bacterium]|nr:TIGR00645 family protein [Rhodospirillaceae bacterium]